MGYTDSDDTHAVINIKKTREISESINIKY